MKPNKEFNVNLLVTSIEKGKPSMSEPMEDKRLERGRSYCAWGCKTRNPLCDACDAVGSED